MFMFHNKLRNTFEKTANITTFSLQKSFFGYYNFVINYFQVLIKLKRYL